MRCVKNENYSILDGKLCSFILTEIVTNNVVRLSEQKQIYLRRELMNLEVDITPSQCL
jgi:Asp-tRNA(Asn)/Glu-tRNA(Gln) amidotransferase B subunit